MTSEEWEKKARETNYPWMTDDQFECYLMLCDLHFGSHHLPGKVKPCGSGVEMNGHSMSLSTFDFDYLTRAVIMAHDRCIRFCVDPSGPGMLKVQLHKREGREGRMYERHPTMEQAIEDFRSKEPTP